MVIALTRPLGAEAIFDTPEGDGNRYEIISGELFVTASPSLRHVKVIERLGKWLDAILEARGLGEVYINPVDVRLTPFDVVVPDLFVLTAERAHLFDERWVTGPPDLIIEALSPSTRGRDLHAKFQLYARTGVREYWVVDADHETVQAYALTANGSYELIPVPDGRVVSRVIPGLDFAMTDLFAGID